MRQFQKESIQKELKNMEDKIKKANEIKSQMAELTKQQDKLHEELVDLFGTKEGEVFEGFLFDWAMNDFGKLEDILEKFSK